MFTLRDANNVMNLWKSAREAVDSEKVGVPSKGDTLRARWLVLIGLVVLAALSACSVSLNTNISPPSGVETPLLSNTAPAGVNLPFVPPDPA